MHGRGRGHKRQVTSVLFHWKHHNMGMGIRKWKSVKVHMSSHCRVTLFDIPSLCTVLHHSCNILIHFSAIWCHTCTLLHHSCNILIHFSAIWCHTCTLLHHSCAVLHHFCAVLHHSRTTSHQHTHQHTLFSHSLSLSHTNTCPRAPKAGKHPGRTTVTHLASLLIHTLTSSSIQPVSPSSSAHQVN